MAGQAEAVVGGVGAAPSRPRRRLLDSLEPYIFLSPGLVLLGLVMFVPVIVGLSYAFRNVQLFDVGNSGWVGPAHFQELVADGDFWWALVNTLWWTGGSLAFQFLLGFGLALLLFRPFRGRRLVQALVFVPWAVPTFLSGLTWA